MGKIQSTNEIIKAIFLKRKSENPQFSLRRLAQKLNISPSYLSRVLAGAKKFPTNKLELLRNVLPLDEFQFKLINESIVYEEYKRKKEILGDTTPLIKNENNINSLAKYKELESQRSELITKWQNVAIMDLTTCANFQFNYKWIAFRLNIPVQDVKESINKLLEAQLLKIENNKLVKQDQHIRMTTIKSKTHVRQFHRSMITKALWEMDQHQDDASFSKRLITGVTIAANPEQVQKVKEILTSAIYNASDVLSTGDCTEVYQLNIQLFGITTKEESIDSVTKNNERELIKGSGDK